MKNITQAQPQQFESQISRHEISRNVSSNPYALLVTLIAFLAMIGLSSCAGYTSSAKTTPTNPGSGVLSAGSTSVTFGSVAVGGNGAFTTLAGGKAAFAIWNGATWQLHVAPAPHTGHGNDLSGVDCLTSAYCVLTGLEGTANTNTGEGLAGVFTGPSTWTWKLVS